MSSLQDIFNKLEDIEGRTDHANCANCGNFDSDRGSVPALELGDITRNNDNSIYARGAAKSTSPGVR
jgi:hypothetical protein